MQKKKTIILFSLSVLFFSLSLVGTYVYAEKPLFGHSWAEMECDTKMCVGSNVGIGTTTPSSDWKVDVNGALVASGEVRSESQMTLLGGSSAGGGIAYSSGNGAYFWGNNDAGERKVQIRTYAMDGVQAYFTAGNVGIGKTNPGHKLDVSGNIGTTGHIYMVDNAHIKNSGTQRGSSAGSWHWWIDSDNNSTDASFTFNKDWDSFNPPSVTLMKIQEDGNVGIGTTSPNARLSVVSSEAKVGTINIGGGLNYDFSYNAGNEADFLFTYTGNHPSGATVFTYNPSGTRTDLMKIYNNGNLWIKGSLTQGSSVKNKKNLEVYKGSFMNRINKAIPYFYNFKTENNFQKKHFGYLAEDLPNEILSEDGNVDMMAYNGMLLKLIQEQQQEIENLRKEVEEIKKEKQAIYNKKNLSFWQRIFGR